MLLWVCCDVMCVVCSCLVVFVVPCCVGWCTVCRCVLWCVALCVLCYLKCDLIYYDVVWSVSCVCETASSMCQAVNVRIVSMNCFVCIIYGEWEVM